MRFVCADGEAQFRELAQAAELESNTLVWYDGRPPDSAVWHERLRDADGLLLLWDLPAGVLTENPHLGAVSFAGTGAGTYVDLEEARRVGVTVCNVPHYGANAIAEHVFALALAVARSIPRGDRIVRSGEWGPGHYAGLELRGRRLGVVGAGPIAARVVQIGIALGMDPVAWTRSPTPDRAERLGAPFVSLDELFHSADVVTLHLAHVPETERIVGRGLLGLLQPHAILVNTARSQLVDNTALVELLEAGSFYGAGIDAFEQEPLPPEDPLLGCERVVLTPHVGFNTPQASAELLRVALENLVAFAAGRPQNVVSAPASA